MKKNMGNNDRVIRILIALVFAILSYFNVVSGVLSVILLALAVVLLTTGLFNFCPLYTLLGINTCKLKE
ncbi:hypothetical protein C7447_101172 [Tenacibaculum adriaticum]|uniref:Inner membrane protein YgaP-like transmembrane domain-containing protein n=1 Tax=Tenacibaculum adriaticum TaxID=413713 RepID=A0A5S5DXP5_9FLAO|nr:DUF2892 domain-containing protein [Tenacibaculum adriaticum]TYP99572.1 hypothetical protein C7447_101172 [Tenacibaculum adriaticum]